MVESGVSVKALWVCMLLSIPALGEDQVFASLESRGYVQTILAVSPNDFTVPALQARAKNFVRRRRGVPFARADIGAGPGVKFYAGKGATDMNEGNYFYRLHKVYPDGVDAYGDIAMVLKCGRSAVLRIRKNAKVYSFDVGDAGIPMPGLLKGIEILHIAPMFNFDSVEGIEVFARSTGRLRQDEIERLASELRSVSPDLIVRVLARNDAWFVTDPHFPFIYAFDESVILPTLNEYMRKSPALIAVSPKN